MSCDGAETRVFRETGFWYPSGPHTDELAGSQFAPVLQLGAGHKKMVDFTLSTASAAVAAVVLLSAVAWPLISFLLQFAKALWFQKPRVAQLVRAPDSHP